MALRRALSKRLIPVSSLIPTFAVTLGEFLQRRAINHHSSPFPSAILSLPVGEKLRDKLRSLNHDYFNPEGVRVGAKDVKRLLRLAKMEEIRERLKNIPANAIPYDEYVAVCGDACGNKEAGLEFAKALDDCGNVIVLGDVVFLRPHQVAQSMEKLISESIAMPDDPRKKELEALEQEKSLIDEQARSKVQLELYGGLGFLGLQTLGFMRLTFWELSWDVMEPICFFATSLHFAIAYAFFLRTSQEPSFQAYFQARFKLKQKRIMEARGFDIQKYNTLRQTFYPNYCDNKCN